VIAIDTSALMAMLLREPMRETCSGALRSANALVMSSVTQAEARIVAAGRDVGSEMDELLDQLGAIVEPATAATARRVAAIYLRWGKGYHPARLNFGDCFAYDVAKQHACPLLYVGDDFSRTDVTPAITA
jgi:ribonuclease VapC